MVQYLRGAERVKRTNKRGRELLYIMLIVVVLVVIMLMITGKQSSLVSVGYDIAELRDRNVELMEERAQLRSVLAALKRPDRIWKEARAMGLVPLNDQNRFRVEHSSQSETDQLVAEIKREP